MHAPRPPLSHVHVRVATPAANPPASRLATLNPYSLPLRPSTSPLYLTPHPPPPQPEEVYEVYTALNAVKGGRFTIAAAFGNVHGTPLPPALAPSPRPLSSPCGVCRRLLAGQCAAHAGHPAQLPEVHQGEGQLRRREARHLRLPRYTPPPALAPPPAPPPAPRPSPLSFSSPRVGVCRRLRLQPRGHPLRHRGGHRQDEY